MDFINVCVSWVTQGPVVNTTSTTVQVDLAKMGRHAQMVSTRSHVLVLLVSKVTQSVFLFFPLLNENGFKVCLLLFVLKEK